MNSKMSPEFESLVRSAQEDDGPVVDVTTAVLQSIQSKPRAIDVDSGERILVVFTTVSFVAASIALLMVFDSVTLFDHPAFDFVQSSGGLFR